MEDEIIDEGKQQACIHLFRVIKSVFGWSFQKYQILTTVDFAETEIYFLIKHNILKNGRFRIHYEWRKPMKTRISPVCQAYCL